MTIQSIAVLGAGQMGNGITQVAAAAGYNVTMIDIEQAYVDKGLATIERSLGKLVSKERMTQEDADATIARIATSVWCRCFVGTCYGTLWSVSGS